MPAHWPADAGLPGRAARLAEKGRGMSAPAAMAFGGLDLDGRLPGVRPQDDLFRHVNGAWIDTATIPEDRPSTGTLRELRDVTEQHVREIVERAAGGDAPEGSELRKIGDLYASFMDEQAIERLGIEPLRAGLAAIAAIESPAGLARALGQFQRQGVSGAFKMYVSTDARRSDRYIMYLAQGGLGMPDESYYRSESLAGIRDGYRAHLEKLLRLAGIDDPAGAARRILALETRLAADHWDRAATRDAVRCYNLTSRAGLDELAPHFDWAAWQDGLGAPGIALAQVVVRQPGYLDALSQALAEVPLADWKLWLAAHLITATAPLLSSDFAVESFEFHQKALAGVPCQLERWKRGLDVVEGALGEALGKAYVAEHFRPEAKRSMLELVATLTEAHRQNLESLDWMGQATKERALEKLAAFTAKIGYPDRWRDYSAIAISRDDLVGNVQRAESAELDRSLAKLGQPVDKDEWLLTPQTVNAYHNPGMNQIVFPAAILQPPFYDPAADAAVNFGGIGAVIGHEIGHGYDDQGSKYDGTGTLNDWWTPGDRAAFEGRAAALIAQYDALEPQQAPGQHVNGALTVGENIGDLGGVALAYRAYLLSLDGAEPPVIAGLTGPQRFFMSWARVWRGKIRDAEISRRLVVDPHSPEEYRCNAVVRNLDAFHEAFAVQPGDGLWLAPASRVRIW